MPEFPPASYPAVTGEGRCNIKKILIIDDSKFMRSVIRRAIEMAAFQQIEIVEQDNAENFVNRLQHENPAIVILDLGLPVISGLEALQEMREAALEVPVLIVSADIQKSTREKCHRFGVAGFLAKPFEAATLADSVRDILEMKGDSP